MSISPTTVRESVLCLTYANIGTKDGSSPKLGFKDLDRFNEFRATAEHILKTDLPHEKAGTFAGGTEYRVIMTDNQLAAIRGYVAERVEAGKLAPSLKDFVEEVARSSKTGQDEYVTNIDLKGPDKVTLQKRDLEGKPSDGLITIGFSPSQFSAITKIALSLANQAQLYSGAELIENGKMSDGQRHYGSEAIVDVGAGPNDTVRIGISRPAMAAIKQELTIRQRA